MQGGWVPLVLLAVVIVACGVVVIAERKRAARLRAFAASRGLTYEKSNQYWVSIDLGWPYGVGETHRARHVMTGQLEGHDIVVFEHKWGYGGGKGRRGYLALVTALRLPLGFPKLTVTREDDWGSISRWIGGKDIELESDLFNRTYQVRSDNRRFAYDVLHLRFMEWMLGTDASGFTISGDYLVVVTMQKLRADRVDPQLTDLFQIAERIPPFVLSAD